MLTTRQQSMRKEQIMHFLLTFCTHFLIRMIYAEFDLTYLISTLLEAGRL